MKQKFLGVILLATYCFFTSPVQSQDTAATPAHLFRLSIDDDFINLRGNGTDEAYSAGINLGFFYNKQPPYRFFINRWLPKAGPGAVNTFGWGIAQLIYTPRDISKVPPERNDYRYAGALVGIHSLYSYNPVKKFSFKTDVVAGVMGPPSGAEEVQTFFHHVINYRLPKGWAYQLPFDVLLNINITAEKMLAEYRQRLELSAGARLAAGSMEDGLTVFAKIRGGIMQPYFNGFILQNANNRTKQRLQLYAFIQPGAELLGYYALIQGGLFNSKPSYYDDKNTPHPTSRKLIGHVDGGLTLAGRKFSLSVTEKIATSLMKDVEAHSVGNISLCIAW